MATKKVTPVVTISPEIARVLREVKGAPRLVFRRQEFQPVGGSFGPAIPGAPIEPVFGPEIASQVQGNVLPGFNKPFQHFLYLRFGDIEQSKAWLRELLSSITALDEVLAWVRLFRYRRGSEGRRDVGLRATWLNVAISARGLRQLLTKTQLAELQDQSFLQGMAERSTYLGDPSDPAHAGHRGRWVVGGPQNEADLMVIIASDLESDLEDRVRDVRTRAKNSGLSLVFEQRGAVLPGDLRGHEHFGFRDGISQPAVRGRASSGELDFIEPRYMDPGDPKAVLYAKPGRPLVWPGQFIIGMARQDPQSLLGTAPPLTRYPSWARHGSFVVARRLRQNVTKFWGFVNATASRVGLSRERVAAALVGRWRSGAPLARVSAGDDPVLGADEFANNHFVYDADTAPAQLIPIAGYVGDTHPAARADFLGKVCPHFAHIRKMNPRDGGTDMGPHTDTLLRLILRRGITYGPPLIGVKNPSSQLKGADRGIMFVCYCASIEEQFEFLQRRWANSAVQPNSGGPDPIIGQSDRRGDRLRVLEFPSEGGGVRLELRDEWVTPTGGGYFFSPTIGALGELVAKTRPAPFFPLNQTALLSPRASLTSLGASLKVESEQPPPPPAAPEKPKGGKKQSTKKRG